MAFLLHLMFWLRSSYLYYLARRLCFLGRCCLLAWIVVRAKGPDFPIKSHSGYGVHSSSHSAYALRLVGLSAGVSIAIKVHDLGLYGFQTILTLLYLEHKPSDLAVRRNV